MVDQGKCIETQQNPVLFGGWEYYRGNSKWFVNDKNVPPSFVLCTQFNSTASLLNTIVYTTIGKQGWTNPPQ